MILFGASMDSSVVYGIAVLPLYMESPPYSCTSIIQLPLTNEHQVSLHVLARLHVVCVSVIFRVIIMMIIIVF